jgi:hypothetical protein
VKWICKPLSRTNDFLFCIVASDLWPTEKLARRIQQDFTKACGGSRSRALQSLQCEEWYHFPQPRHSGVSLTLDYHVECMS